MIFKSNFKMGLKDIEKDNSLKNRAMLEYFENIGAYHSDLVGYGAEYTRRTGISWVLLSWDLKVINRPQYGQELEIHTWARGGTKVATYRDFEIYDENKNLCVIATSKWALINIKEGKILKIEDEILTPYEPENKRVFEEKQIKKLRVPDKFTSDTEYEVKRKDIDLNGHMHNLYYLDLAYEALPEDVYNNNKFDNVLIYYKKETKLHDKLHCKYVFSDNKHIVGIYNENEDILHSIIELC